MNCEKKKKRLFIYTFFKLVTVKYTVVNVLFLVLREGKYVVKYNMCIHVPVSYLKYRKTKSKSDNFLCNNNSC